MLLRSIYSLLVCLLLLTGCGAATVADGPQPSANPTTPATATPEPTMPSATSTIMPSEPTAPATATAIADDSEEWQTYSNDAGGYVLEIPAMWGISGEPAAAVQFFDQDTADMTKLETGEPEFFDGGVDILGFIASEPDPYQAVLPNQSAIVDMQPIETPLGPGRVYTLRRDRSEPMGDETVWYAQHALIPANDRIYEIWVKVDATTRGDPVPTLKRMVAEFWLEPQQ